MSEPTVIWRKLSVTFARSVSFPDQTPITMQVMVFPLAEASASPVAAATFVSPAGVQDVVLARDTTVEFELIPSHLAGLSGELIYRIQWRAGVTGRTFTFDFAMPDQDVSFHDLADLGNIIDGEVYLRQQDLGVPGRVARLNIDGHVVDAAGQVLATTGAVNSVNAALNAEKLARQQADAQIAAQSQEELELQINSVLSTTAANLSNAVASLQSTANNDRAARISGDNALGNRIDGVENDLGELTNLVGEHTEELEAKADLGDDGKIPLEQIPDSARTTGVPVASIEDMLALTEDDIQQWDFAYGATVGVWALIGTDRANINHWYKLNKVNSVNGQDGDIILDLSDIAAQGGQIAISNVDGLATALENAGDAEAIDALDGRVGAIESDSTIVRTVEGVIPHELNDEHMAYINDEGKVTDKAGNVIVVPGSGSVTSVNGEDGVITLDLTDVSTQGGEAPIEQITGLSEVLGNKVDDDDARLSDARTPTSHAASHASDGSDPITITTGQVDGLSAILSNNALTGSSNHGSRLAALENASLNEIQALLVDASGGSYTLTYDEDTTDPIAHDDDEAAIAAALTALESIGSGGVSVTEDTDYNGSGTRYLIEFTGALSVTNVETLAVDDASLTGTAEISVVQNGGGGTGGTTRAAWWLGTETFTGVEAAADFATEHGVQLRGPFSVDGDGKFTYSPTGVAPLGDSYVFPHITRNGHLELREWNEDNPPDPAYALASDLSSLEGIVGGKADAGDLSNLEGIVAGKADQSDLELLQGTLGSKADQSDLELLQSTVSGKADASDLSDLEGVVSGKADASDLSDAVGDIIALQTGKADLSGGTVPLDQLPSYPISKVTNLSSTLDDKADLVEGVVPIEQLPTDIPTANIDGLDEALSARPTVNGSGKLSSSVIPAIALTTVKVVANKAAMLAFTSSDVQIGDIVKITSTSDKGTYVLADDDPSDDESWVKFDVSDGNISSVNGMTGEVVLTAEDVGARSLADPLAISDVTGLQSALDLKASTSALSSGLAGKTSTSDVQTLMTNSVPVKQQALRVATSAVASLSGSQSIDGALVSAGNTVLLTAQESSVNNGLWVVNSGAWTRPTDYANGSYFLRGTIVAVSAGNTNANTLWQQTASSGVVGTNNTSWTRIGYVAPPFSPTAGNGIEVSGSTFTVKPATSGGISVSSGGVAIDTNTVARKVTGTVPSGNTTATITHNLGTNNVMVQIIEAASNVMVLAGVTIISTNAVQVEFATAPTTGQYRYIVIG